MDIKSAEQALAQEDEPTPEPGPELQERQPVEQRVVELQDAEADRQRKLDNIFKPRQRMSIQYIKGQLRKFLDNTDNQSEFLKHRPKPGARRGSTKSEDQLTYLSWDDCVKIMDKVTRGMWSFVMPYPLSYSPNGVKVTAYGRVTIYAAEGDFSYDDIGCGWPPVLDVDPNSGVMLYPLWSPSIEWVNNKPQPKLNPDGTPQYRKSGQGFDEEIKAKQQAWKRCLSQTGLALDLYDADFVKELQEQSE